ncbi:MAG: OmpA family protein [Candidatus Thiodiazotropha endolucinida]
MLHILLAGMDALSICTATGTTALENSHQKERLVMQLSNIIERAVSCTLIAVCVLAVETTASAADVKDSADHPLISRFPGSSIMEYRFREFDEFTLPTGAGYSTKREVEGKLTEIRYTSGSGNSPAQVFRSYWMALEEAGYTDLYECKQQQCGVGIKQTLGKFEGPGVLGDDCRYKAAHLVRDAGDMFVSLLVCDWWSTDKVATFLDVIEAEPLEGGLITISAEQLQEDILQEGHTALYGVYFDTNKADLKPASKPTLDEVSRLLHENADLKILVVGHTDNAGELAYNVLLSQRRAQAVINALVNSYGIDAGRLHAFGAGMYAPVASNSSEKGRALNRRVELVER